MTTEKLSFKDEAIFFPFLSPIEFLSGYRFQPYQILFPRLLESLVNNIPGPQFDIRKVLRLKERENVLETKCSAER